MDLGTRARSIPLIPLTSYKTIVYLCYCVPANQWYISRYYIYVLPIYRLCGTFIDAFIDALSQSPGIFAEDMVKKRHLYI